MTTIFIRDQDGKAYTIPKPFEIVTTPGEPTYHGFVELVKWGAPRQTFRPWNIKEWGERIGDRFLFEGRQCQLNKIFNPDYLEFHDVQSPVMQLSVDLTLTNATQRVTQLDGQPCGTYEEISQ